MVSNEPATEAGTGISPTESEDVPNLSSSLLPDVSAPDWMELDDLLHCPSPRLPTTTTGSTTTPSSDVVDADASVVNGNTTTQGTVSATTGATKSVQSPTSSIGKQDMSSIEKPSGTTSESANTSHYTTAMSDSHIMLDPTASFTDPASSSLSSTPGTHVLNVSADDVPLLLPTSVGVGVPDTEVDPMQEFASGANTSSDRTVQPTFADMDEVDALTTGIARDEDIGSVMVPVDVGREVSDEHDVQDDDGFQTQVDQDAAPTRVMVQLSSSGANGEEATIVEDADPVVSSKTGATTTVQRTLAAPPAAGAHTNTPTKRARPASISRLAAADVGVPVGIAKKSRGAVKAERVVVAAVTQAVGDAGVTSAPKAGGTNSRRIGTVTATGTAPKLTTHPPSSSKAVESSPVDANLTTEAHDVSPKADTVASATPSTTCAQSSTTPAPPATTPSGGLTLAEKRRRESARFPSSALESLAGTTSAEVRRMTGEERELVLYKRKLRNRESARRSRQKRQATLAELQEEVDDLVAATNRMLDVGLTLKSQNDSLKQQLDVANAELRALRAVCGAQTSGGTTTTAGSNVQAVSVVGQVAVAAAAAAAAAAASGASDTTAPTPCRPAAPAVPVADAAKLGG